METELLPKYLRELVAHNFIAFIHAAGCRLENNLQVEDIFHVWMSPDISSFNGRIWPAKIFILEQKILERILKKESTFGSLFIPLSTPATIACIWKFGVRKTATHALVNVVIHAILVVN